MKFSAESGVQALQCSDLSAETLKRCPAAFAAVRSNQSCA